MSRLIALVGCFALVVGASFAGDACRKEAEGAYAKWNRLVAAKDKAGLMAMLAPDYYQMNLEGKKSTKAEFAKFCDQMFPICRSMKSKVVIEQCSQFGDELTAWITYSMTFEMKQGKAWSPMSFSLKQVEILRRTPKGWVFVSSLDLP